MIRNAQPPTIEGEPEGEDPGFDPLSPIVLKSYFKNFARIMGRQMPNVSLPQLYQDGFNQMIDLLLPDNKKYNLEYLNEIVTFAKELGFDIKIPSSIRSEIIRKETAREEEEERKRLEEEERRRQSDFDKTLEGQLEKAIKEQRYEDAAVINEKIKAMKRTLVPESQYEGTLCLGEHNG